MIVRILSEIFLASSRSSGFDMPLTRTTSSPSTLQDGNSS
jgi:hypothetical protein